MTSKLKFDSSVLMSLNFEFSNQIINQGFSNPKFNKKRKDCSLIYHYTSIDNFINIIQNQSLYFTNLFYLNDQLELQYGIEFIKRIVKEIDSKNKIISKLIDEHIESKINSNRYVLCFSLNGDLLSQWRAYGDYGRGVTIGFDSWQLKRALANITRQTHIEYDEAFQNELFKEMINQHITFFETRKESIDWGIYNYEEQAAISIIQSCESLIDSLKHPSFSEEEEYRFTHVHGEIKEEVEIKFRTKANNIIPFIEIPTTEKHFYDQQKQGIWSKSDKPSFSFDNLPVKEIILGPCLEENKILPALKLILKNNGYNNVEIIKSRIPYRI
jgi:hypothetical protein